MKKINQTKFGKLNGNCMAACMASLLELPLGEVPDFGQEGGWWSKLQAWVAGFEYSALEVRWPIGEGAADGEHVFPNEGQICWAVGNSPRGDFKHAVLVQWEIGDWKIIHDPHPDKTGFDGDIELV